MKPEFEPSANDMSRRQLLTSTALGVGAALIAGNATAQERTGTTQVRAESFAQGHQPKTPTIRLGFP